jgi:hypothetical protein
VDADPGDAPARRDARWAAYQSRSRRTQQKFRLGLALFWVLFAG